MSGNAIQVPIHIPINVCGNTVNIVGLLNPAFGNTCINGSIERRVVVHHHHRHVEHHHARHTKKHPRKHRHHRPAGGVHTGGGGMAG
uniref:Chaplin domain-containing protein n=1 Tax=Streptomyces auratus AGR0001 TaxID=1160718 RepID=J2JUZ1_9ACTN